MSAVRRLPLGKLIFFSNIVFELFLVAILVQNHKN